MKKCSPYREKWRSTINHNVCVLHWTETLHSNHHKTPPLSFKDSRRDRIFGKADISGSRLSVRFQKARGIRESPFHLRLTDMTPVRHRGKEKTTLVKRRERGSTDKTVRWIDTCAHTYTHTHTLFLPLYILIRERLCPELSHIVRNFLSEWQANPRDMAFADSAPNLDSKTENFRLTHRQMWLRLSNPDKEKINKLTDLSGGSTSYTVFPI